MKHVYDWLDEPALNEGEKQAKDWLDKFTKPAYTKHVQKLDIWLNKHKLTCEYQGRRLQCTGASRMGDVWLKEDNSKSYYDYRVSVEELSNWELTNC